MSPFQRNDERGKEIPSPSLFALLFANRKLLLVAPKQTADVGSVTPYDKSTEEYGRNNGKNGQGRLTYEYDIKAYAYGEERCYGDRTERNVSGNKQNDKEQAEKRVHILQGYVTALDNIDEVIKLIRASASIPEAKQALIDRFELSEVQSQAIVEMPLGRLSGMERDKVTNELSDKLAFIEKMNAILGDENLVKDIIKEELTVIKKEA
jgi:hypothetical protein